MKAIIQNNLKHISENAYMFETFFMNDCKTSHIAQVLQDLSKTLYVIADTMYYLMATEDSQIVDLRKENK